MDFEVYLDKTREELRLGAYSPRTVKSYLGCLRRYFKFCKKPGQMDAEQIRSFLLWKEENGAAPQTVNLYLNAIKFFYREVLKDPRRIRLRFARRSRRLPVVLSREEVTAILSVTKNLKHRTLLALAYGAGLRVSEVLNIKVKDLDFAKYFVHVHQGKGRKDRLTILPESLEEALLELCCGAQQDAYVFESQRGGKLTTRTAQKVFKAGLEKAGIYKAATFHSLRHSFASHLIEDGVNLRYVQKLLGHENIRTTQGYTHVQTAHLKRIRSPLSQPP